MDIQNQWLVAKALSHSSPELPGPSYPLQTTTQSRPFTQHKPLILRISVCEYCPFQQGFIGGLSRWNQLRDQHPRCKVPEVISVSQIPPQQLTH